MGCFSASIRSSWGIGSSSGIFQLDRKTGRGTEGKGARSRVSPWRGRHGNGVTETALDGGSSGHLLVKARFVGKHQNVRTITSGG